MILLRSSLATELTTTKKMAEPHTGKANTSPPCRRTPWWSCSWMAPGSPPGCPPQWWRRAAGRPFSLWTPRGWAASHCQTPGLQRWLSSPERIETSEIRVFYHLLAGSQVEKTVNMFECKGEGNRKCETESFTIRWVAIKKKRRLMCLNAKEKGNRTTKWKDFFFN